MTKCEIETEVQEICNFKVCQIGFTLIKLLILNY